MRVIILGRQISGENDLSLTVYSQEKGLSNLKARGAAKASSKLAGHLEPCSLVELEVLGGKILGATGENMYASIKSNYLKLKYAGQALFLFTQKLRKEEADPALFNFLASWLEFIDESSGQEEALFCFWCLKLPRVLGWNFDYGQFNSLAEKVFSAPWKEAAVFPLAELREAQKIALSLWEY